jgi:5'-nucleotidase (lipoprotein e(P4) family)
MRIPLSLLILLVVFGSFKADKPIISENDHLTLAVLYQQHAPEYRALCYQAYNLASVRIQQIVKRKGSAEGLAIVLDLDETVLDNSPYEAKCILENINYPVKWKEWCELAIAEPVPGSVEFINLAASLGVQVVYISNRKEELREATKKNLVAIGLPDTNDDYLLLRDAESAKEERRQKIAAKYEIVLLIGDNLNDFSEVFENSRGEGRMAKTDDMKRSFSEKFIVLPNAMYGDWEQHLYPENAETPQQRRKARYDALKSF